VVRSVVSALRLLLGVLRRASGQDHARVYVRRIRDFGGRRADSSRGNNARIKIPALSPPSDSVDFLGQRAVWDVESGVRAGPESATCLALKITGATTGRNGGCHSPLLERIWKGWRCRSTGGSSKDMDARKVGVFACRGVVHVPVRFPLAQVRPGFTGPCRGSMQGTGRSRDTRRLRVGG
jgi:hypothetical protein